MKTLKRLKLNQLGKAELAEREMKTVFGGACGCGCCGDGTWGSSIQDNSGANAANDQYSPGCDNVICSEFKPGGGYLSITRIH